MKISPDIFENTEIAYQTKSDADLHKAKALFQLMSNNSIVSLGSSLATFALSLHLPVSPLFRYTVYNNFCGGTFAECKDYSKAGSGVGVLLNYGVELKKQKKTLIKPWRRISKHWNLLLIIVESLVYKDYRLYARPVRKDSKRRKTIG